MGVLCGSLCALQRPQRVVNGYLEDRVEKRCWVFWVLQLLGAAIKAPGGFVPPVMLWVAHGDALHGSVCSWGRAGLGWAGVGVWHLGRAQCPWETFRVRCLLRDPSPVHTGPFAL